MPYRDPGASPDTRGRRRDRRFVLNAVIKHLGQESCRERPSFEERNAGFPDVICLFRDFLAAKSSPRA
ncbi:MAG: hypothetical protein A4E73_01311 [Syntrophaceae bacterium PtaU1.Bin231]|nr:MAG: hypothetical protein A4E73_01311 [Syntrophaceae bacterium PtaU1.Bin231]